MKSISVRLIGIIIGVLVYQSSWSQQTINNRTIVPFRADSVIYYNEDSSIKFGATLRIPEHTKPCPAVIIVSGTGKQDRDGTMAGHKVFAALADYLAQRGIAVLCVDDRGTGLTTGVYETSTTADFAKDALTGINYIKTRKEIDKKQIGLLGHSEGGAVICIAAAQSPDVAYLVSLSGLCMKGYDALIKQNQDIVNSADIPDYNKKRFNEITSLMFSTVYTNADSANLEQKLRIADSIWQKKDAAYFKTLNIKYDHFFFPFESYLKQATGPWYRYFIKYDPADYLPKINIPILAVNGDKDVMVSYRENLDNWVKYSAMGGNTKVTTVVLPGLNHLYQHCKECTVEESYTLKENIAPEALDVIGNWIEKKFN